MYDVSSDNRLLLSNSPTSQSIVKRWEGFAFRSPEKISFRSYALDEIRVFTPDEKIDLAEKLFDEVDAMGEELARRYRNSGGGNGPLMDIREWYENRWTWFQHVDEAILKGFKDRDERLYLLYRDYRSSMRQAIGHRLGCLYLAAEQCRSFSADVRLTYNFAPKSTIALSRYDRRMVVLYDNKGFRIDPSKNELARHFTIRLRNLSTYRKWHNSRLVFHIHRDAFGETVGGFLPWPLDPQEPVMQSLQRVLGWRFDVRVSNDLVTIAIDFGEGLEVAPK